MGAAAAAAAAASDIRCQHSAASGHIDVQTRRAGRAYSELGVVREGAAVQHAPRHGRGGHGGYDGRGARSRATRVALRHDAPQLGPAVVQRVAPSASTTPRPLRWTRPVRSWPRRCRYLLASASSYGCRGDGGRARARSMPLRARRCRRPRRHPRCPSSASRDIAVRTVSADRTRSVPSTLACSRMAVCAAVRPVVGPRSWPCAVLIHGHIDSTTCHRSQASHSLVSVLHWADPSWPVHR